MENNSETIRKEHIYSGILAGAERVSENREVLNESNAFPVLDKDTGNNLSHLMQNIVGDSISDGTIKDMLDNVSNLAIVGARGNSGAIFSQFFYGFSAFAPNKDEMTTDDLILCFENGQEFAHKAIKNPVEGTIITVIRSWVESLKKVFSPHKSLNEIYEQAYPLLKDSVEETKYTLKAQRKMQSEDAGAKAFLYFIEGFMPMLINKVTGYKPADKVVHKRIEKFVHESDIDFGSIENKYCTEVLLEKYKSFDRSKLETKLNEMGDSIVISESDKYVRAHIHTNHPSKIVKMFYPLGKVLESKADNMVSQYELTKKHDGKVALVIDSIADIDPSRLNDDTFLLPINILVDDISYQDKVTAIPEVIQMGRTSTSQPNLMQVKKFLEPILDSYDDVIIITVSSKMSGVYERFNDAVEELSKKSNVYLVDSKQNSVAEGLVVEYATRLINEGLKASEIKEKLEGVIARTKIYVSLPNLKGMIASGRLSTKIGKVMQFIGFLPLISIDSNGKGVAGGLAFSKKKNEEILLKKVESVKDKIDSFAVVHADNYELASSMAKKIEEMTGKEVLYIDEISSVIRLFSGPGSVAIGYTLGEDK